MNTVSKFLFAIMLTIGYVNLNAGDTQDQKNEMILELQARINAKQIEYENQYQLTLHALKEEILSSEKTDQSNTALALTMAQSNAVLALTNLKELFLASNRLNLEKSQARMGSTSTSIDKTTEINALQERLQQPNQRRLATFVNNDNIMTMTDGQKLQLVEIYDGITAQAQAQAQAQSAQRAKIQSYLLRGAKATAAVIVGVAFVKSGLAQKSFHWIARALTSLNKMIQFKRNIVLVNVPAART